MSSTVRLADWFAGGAARPLVIAEVAQAHDGSLGTAHAFIDAVAEAGAAAVKFQTHIAAAESTPAEPWRQPFSLQDASRYDYWRRMEFSREQWQGLKRHAEELGLVFLSSPFSEAAIDLLEGLGIEGWKVASGEVGHRQLLAALRATGKPVILSSGMSPWTELDAAVETLRRDGGAVAVLQCTSSYPCPPEAVGLNLLAELHRRYDCPVGLSDHSGTIFPGLAAVTLGATLLEVHVTLSRRAFGPDVPASLTPRQLRRLVEGVGFVRRMLDHPVDKDGMAAELAPMRALFTRSVVAARHLAAGRILERGDLAIKKPGTGLPPERLETLVGRRLAVGLEADQLIAPQHLEGDVGTAATSGAGSGDDE